MSVLLSCLQLKRDAITVLMMLMLMLMLDDASSSNE
jgi:hypothetical protein